MSTAERYGEELFAALRERRTVPPLIARSEGLTIDDAYRISLDFLARRTAEGERVVGEVRLGALHAGAPGLVHGGILATLLDEVLGHAAIVTGATVVTATLKIRYHRPTPIATPLRCEGWIVERSGRRFRTRGHVIADGERTVSAEGVFVDVGGRPFSELLAGG